ncbi:Fc receptor-like protein 5 isoform X7 [Herpailurus yagouaroundi]|uniref:Fc receptor-like protein 5 isoform X7 n=1 Tax=Herpailurus yagouaroundi TaxID=1608482 RepID=UPI001AD6BA73|nr:Fc receptor-like protein 5 isoform X7 [Puma yagouaroundi]
MSSSGLLWSCASQESKPALLLLRKALIWPHPRAGQAFMLLWVSVLVLAPVSGKSEAAAKPVISLHPPWTVVFTGETVTLTCHVLHFHAPEKIKRFLWYLEGRMLRETPGNTLEVRDSGQYRCQTQDSLPSDHVSLTFSSANLILQAPPFVFEGDSVVLRCRANAEITLDTTTLHRRGEVLSVSDESSDFRIEQASLKDNGDYRCSGFKNGCCSYSSNTINIEVQELFPRPVLTASLSPTVSGKSVTLTCKTQLPPLRSDVKLWFRFFEDDHMLQLGLESFLKISTLTTRSRDPPYYWCEAQRGSSGVCKQSQKSQLHVQIPVSRPVLTLSPRGASVPEGHTVTLTCKAESGSFPILYQFLREEVVIQKMEPTPGMKSVMSLRAEHSGNYYCTADNGLGAQRSLPVYLTVTVPVSRPILTIRRPRSQVVEGDVVELYCGARKGSPPILYRFYHEDNALGSSRVYSREEASFKLPLSAEHSGNYSCEADNGLGAQRSEVVPLSVIVPVSHPTLTLRAPGAQAKVGDMVELRCEAQRGSPPIWYRFYHEDVPLGNSSAPSGGGASLNLSLTAEHSGNYSCEADNGLGARRSEAVPLSMSGLTGSRSGPIATGVTGGLFSTLGFGVVALLLYCRLPRKAGGRPTSDPSRSPADSDVREPVYRNAPAWLELQPVYSNVNPKGGEVVYSEVRRIPQGSKPAANSDSVLGLLRTHLPSHGQAASHRPSDPPGSSVIYSQVKVACPSACVAPQS